MNARSISEISSEGNFPILRAPPPAAQPKSTPTKTYNSLTKDTKALNVDLKESGQGQEMVAKGTWRNYQPIAMWPGKAGNDPRCRCWLQMEAWTQKQG